MNIRKYFNILNKSQHIIINDEISSIMMKCEAIAFNEEEDLKNSKYIHDNTCPKCKTQNNVVDKLSYVHGKYVVINNSWFSSAGVGSNVIIDTTPVNHCNSCGNEWVKFKEKRIDAKDMLRVALNYYCQLEMNPSEKRHEWKLELVDVFKGCHAESIYRLSRKHLKYIRENNRSALNISYLRKKYESIYDK